MNSHYSICQIDTYNHTHVVGRVLATDLNELALFKCRIYLFLFSLMDEEMGENNVANGVSKAIPLTMIVIL